MGQIPRRAYYNLGVLKLAILRYEVLHAEYDADGTKHVDSRDVHTFDTLKEARAFIRRAFPDYVIVNQYREHLYNGYGFTHYAGDAKILYCEKRHEPPRQEPKPAPRLEPKEDPDDWPDMVLQQIGGWY